MFFHARGILYVGLIAVFAKRDCLCTVHFFIVIRPHRSWFFRHCRIFLEHRTCCFFISAYWFIESINQFSRLVYPHYRFFFVSTIVFHTHIRWDKRKRRFFFHKSQVIVRNRQNITSKHSGQVIGASSPMWARIARSAFHTRNAIVTITNSELKGTLLRSKVSVIFESKTKLCFFSFFFYDNLMALALALLASKTRKWVV